VNPIQNAKRGRREAAVTKQVRRLDSLKPAPENDVLYKAIAYDDPELLELARSIKERGIQEPLLVSRDGYIISGHRRRIAALIAGLDLVPVRVHEISREQNLPQKIRAGGSIGVHWTTMTQLYRA
jgi:hypothetical protein